MANNMIGIDPLLTGGFSQNSNFSFEDEIDSKMQYLQAMKEQISNKRNINKPKHSIWNDIDSEIRSLNNEQRNILFKDKTYIEIDNQLKGLIQEALFESVKDRIEESNVGKDLLVKQLNFIRSSKEAILIESNKQSELLNAFRIASANNPNLTYKQFIKSLNE